MKKFILILLIILTFSCDTKKEIDFHIYNNLPVINAQINGMSVKLLIDTGASVSIIDTSTEFCLLFKGTDLREFRKNNGIVGIIGADFLSKHNLVIDFYNRKIKEGALE